SVQPWRSLSSLLCPRLLPRDRTIARLLPCRLQHRLLLNRYDTFKRAQPRPAHPPAAMSRLFLSYARGDDETFVERLYEALTARGFDIWRDRSSMPSRGLTFHQEIRDTISACERLLLVVGPKAVASDYVRQEWQYAWFEAEKVVVPILRIGELPIAVDELKL